MSQSSIKRLTIKSKSLNKDMPVWVYLPYNYNDSKEYFPCLYFLHGRSGNETILTETDLNVTADKLISQHKIKPMIIVCPDLENSRGINSALECKEVKDSYGRTINLGLYEDYFIKEVIPQIETQFRIIHDRKARCVGGASAGGYAALHLAFRHPELFYKVGGHMPAIELKLEEEDKAYFPNPDDWSKYNPIQIIKNVTRTDFRIYLDAGNKDEGKFYQGCAILHKILEEKGISSENHVFEGHHNIEYIKSNIEKYLIFYGS